MFMRKYVENKSSAYINNEKNWKNINTNPLYRNI